jgi:hypothetical protein
MRLTTCPREKEVKDLVERGRWPAAETTAPELRTHVNGCHSCSEWVQVTMAFKQARTQAFGEARIGSPGVLWWRAQLRRRNEAVERISRPILGAQVFALAMLLVLAAGMAVWQARSGVAWLTRLEQLPQKSELNFDTFLMYALTGSQWNWFVILPAIATVALLGGVVVFLATEKP